ncbi:MAG: ABC transporter permease [Cytophagales bacterium]|nr:ABC transporter permease [Cytophagales bacterium]
MSGEKRSPPAFMVWLLQRLCKKELIEFVLGDLEEQFEEQLALKGNKKASWRYIWQAVKFLRPGILKSIKDQKLNPYTMFLHDVKTSFRLIRREKLYAAINIIGLSSAFAIALLIFWYVGFEQSYESYNPNADRVVRLTTDYFDGETVSDQDCETYHPLGQMIADELPQVEAFAHAFEIDELLMRSEQSGKTFRVVGGAFFVEPEFFQMFHYPLLKGNPEAIFEQPNEMILTESYAKRYFGTTEILGKTVDMLAFKAKVVGIIPDSPPNTHLKVNILVSYETAENAYLASRESPWNMNDTYTYFQLKDASMVADFQKALVPFSVRMMEVENFDEEQVIAQAIKDIHLYSDKSFEVEKNGDATTVLFLMGVAFLVILIAMVNYVNLSTSKSMDRAKEVGIRKVIGSSIGQLRMRFFTESLVINFLSILATVFLVGLFVDPFKFLAGLPMELDIFQEQDFWLTLVALFLVSVVLSGSFPAFIIARFKPVTILRGKYSHSQSGTILRKGLVIFQFAIALFLLVQTITANEQLQFLRNLDKGANFEEVMVIRTPLGEEMSKFETFQEKVEQYPFVKTSALSNCVPGLPTSQMGSTTGLNILGEEERNFNFYVVFIDTAYLQTLEMELLAGRNFINSDTFSTVMVNEEAIRLWGFTNPAEVIDKKIDMWGAPRRVIGVIRNFHQTNIKDNYIPMIFPPNQGKWGNYMSIKLSTEDLPQQIAAIEGQFQELFPNSPFDFFFLDQEFGKEYEADERFRRVFGSLSIFSLIITCLGLFGLASFTVAKRTKEIGIRKVLGASVAQVVSLISKEFIVLIVIGMGIAMPLTVYLVQSWLGRYAFRIELNPLLFIVPALMIVVVALITVWARTYRVSVANPVESLRDE